MNPDTPANVANTEMYARLGMIVRDLHDALRALGADHVLSEAANEFPSARERLLHIGQLTEKAANTVLSKVEEIGPVQESLSASAQSLASQWDQVTPEAMPAALHNLVNQTRGFLSSATGDAIATRENLQAIMMAQDFQDLTGQLIKKVVDVMARTEKDLLHLLIDTHPQGAAQHVQREDLLAGPGAPGGVALAQDDVDDLLADLGF